VLTNAGNLNWHRIVFCLNWVCILRQPPFKAKPPSQG
jgi:hypothetical protein